MSKVSVIVPIYNAGNKLHKCIKSILNQSFADFELILVNDGSIDNSLEKCRKYAAIDNRIRIISKENEGSVLTRKKGVEAAKSEYIMFADADDWIHHKTIETLYDELVKNGADITVCNMFRAIGNGVIKKKVKSWYFNNDEVYDEKKIKEDLVTAYFHGHPFPSSLCAKLYKKDLVVNSGNYLKNIKFLGDDLFYNLEIFLKAKKVKLIDQPLYYYRYGGTTSKYMPHLFEDMVNGYKIQSKVIQKHYKHSLQKQYNGISVMLLNTFKSCLTNLFYSHMSEKEIEHLIKSYTMNEVVRECLDNEGAVKCFSNDYLSAIKNNNIHYLYQLGETLSKERRLSQKVLHKLCNLGKTSVIRKSFIPNNN